MNDFLQLNGSQVIEEHKESNDTQKWTKILQNSSHGESDRYENNLCIWTTGIIPFKGY